MEKLTQDYYGLDNVVWCSQNIFATLLEYNPKLVIISDNEEYLNNSYRYIPYPPIFYCVSRVYHPLNPGKEHFDFYFNLFLERFNIFGDDLRKIEILTLCYESFSPYIKYPILSQQSIPRLAYGVRLSADSLDDSIVIMTDICYRLFYLEEWQDNVYFGGR